MAANPVHIVALAKLRTELTELQRAVITEAEQIVAHYRGGGDASSSLWNFAHYLALRSRDLRPLQERLARAALSSLGRCEAHVMATLEQLVAILDLALDLPGAMVATAPVDFDAGERLLGANRALLFGPLPSARTPHIMVTLPAEAATDRALVEDLLRSGMDCGRINCAHDTPAEWQAMIANVRAAAAAHGKPCRILMDLAGPKLRTGAVATGAVTLSETLRLVTDRPPRTRDDESIALGFPATMITALRCGDRIHFTDRRGLKRVLDIAEDDDTGTLIAHCAKRAIIDGTTEFQFPDPGTPPLRAILADDSATFRLYEGDRLMLTREQTPGRPALADPAGGPPRPAAISCGEPAALDYLHPGDEIWIDDGKLGGVIDRIDAEGALITITHAGPKGRKLRADKGINFPTSRIELPALTAKDYRDLDFIAQHADLVGLSFAQSLADLGILSDALAARGADTLPMIAKIETARGVENLPEMLLGTLDHHPLGVMIARGDLMVEVGGERMAELQEEILWLCEAAHVPVIWATQVLETLAKKGTLSRPEITDAAASARADCVMLNKGPHVARAVALLADVLHRMEGHQHKKNPQLRALSLTSRITSRAAPTPLG